MRSRFNFYDLVVIRTLTHISLRNSIKEIEGIHNFKMAVKEHFLDLTA